MDLRLTIEGPVAQQQAVDKVLRNILGDVSWPKLTTQSFVITIRDNYGIIQQITKSLDSIPELSYSYLWDPVLGPDGESWAVVKMQQKKQKPGFLLSHETEGLKWVANSALKFDYTLGVYTLPGAVRKPSETDKMDPRWTTMAALMKKPKSKKTKKGKKHEA